MKRLLVASALLALAAVPLAATDVVPSGWWKPAPSAAPQPGIVLSPVLDGTWWRLKVKANGATISLEDGSIGKETFKTTAYMFLADDILKKAEGIDPSLGDGGIPLYEYTMVTFVDGNWVPTHENTLFVNGADGSLVTDSFMGFITDDGAVGARFTGQFKLKFDEGQIEGEAPPLKKGSLKTLGSELFEASLFTEGPPIEGIPGSLKFVGAMKISGKFVQPDDLPFDL